MKQLKRALSYFTFIVVLLVISALTAVAGPDVNREPADHVPRLEEAGNGSAQGPATTTRMGIEPHRYTKVGSAPSIWAAEEPTTGEVLGEPVPNGIELNWETKALHEISPDSPGDVHPVWEIVASVTETIPADATLIPVTQPLSPIMTEGYESIWPSTGWILMDASSSDGGEYLWGKRDCHPHAGTYGGWAIGGGLQGSQLPCTASYPNYLYTWQIYGPFDLSNATAASLTFYYWGETEFASGCIYDYFFTGSSIDGSNFTGPKLCGDWTNGGAGNGYYQYILDLSSRLGQSQVWVAHLLSSDSSVTKQGITVDDITLDVTASPPPPPNAFNKSNPTNGASGISISPTLSWAASGGAASYEYCIDTSNNNSCDASWTSTGASTSVALSSLANGTTYYWQVRAVNPGGMTYANGGTWWTFATLVTGPGVFNKSSPANGASGVVTSPTLSWAASAGAGSYEYCIDTSNNTSCDASWTSTGASTSVALSSLDRGATYYWQVRAKNASGTTYANGNAWWSFTTVSNASYLPIVRLPIYPPAAPTLNPINNSNGAPSFTVSWNNVPAASSYVLQEDNNAEFSSPNTVYSGANTSATITVGGAGTYFYRVRAVNAGGNSPWSNVRDTSVTPPAAPTLNPINNPGGNASYVVSWNTVANATSYLLQEDDNAAFSSPSNVYSGAGTSTTVAVGATGTYYYRVGAVNAVGSSAWSNTQSTTVTNLAPNPGNWAGTTSRGFPMSFEVSADGTQWSTFSLETNGQVGPCFVTLTITSYGPGNIINNQFSGGGTFAFSGQFTTPTTATGTYSFNGHYVFGCGYLYQTGTWTAVPSLIVHAFE